MFETVTSSLPLPVRATSSPMVTVVATGRPQSLAALVELARVEPALVDALVDDALVVVEEEDLAVVDELSAPPAALRPVDS